MDQLCLTCQLDLGLFTRGDVYYHQLRHHKDHLKPAAPPGALRCPLKPLYDKQGGKIRLRRLQLIGPHLRQSGVAAAASPQKHPSYPKQVSCLSPRSWILTPLFQESEKDERGCEFCAEEIGSFDNLERAFHFSAHYRQIFLKDPSTAGFSGRSFRWWSNCLWMKGETT